MAPPEKSRPPTDGDDGGHHGHPVVARKPTLKEIWISMGAFYLVIWLLAYTSISFLIRREAHDQPQGQEDVCLTPACVHAASEILYNLADNYKNMDACTDFEELVCSGWKERHDLRPDQGTAFTGTIMAENSQTLLRHILEAPYPEDSSDSYWSPVTLSSTDKPADQVNFDKMKAAYDACLDENTIKEAGAAPLMEILDRVVALFPAAAAAGDGSTAGANRSAIRDTVQYLASLQVVSLAQVGTGADDRAPDTVVVAVMAPDPIGLPAKERYLDEKLVGQYRAVIGQVLNALFPDKPHDDASLDALMDFEKKLAAASPDAEDRQDVTKYYNPMTLAEADGLTPQLGLAGIISSLAPADADVDRIIVAAPAYMKSLSDLLDTTSANTLQSYFIWKSVQDYSGFIESEETKPYRQFVNVLQGKDPDSAPERWRTCVGHVDDGLGWILSRFFIEKAFSEKAKEFGNQIVSDIKNVFIKRLGATEWMEEKVVEAAVNKVHNIVQKIGYPTQSPDITDPSALEGYYRSINITSSFFHNGIAVSEFATRDEWAALGKPVDRNRWGMTASTVNAYYNPPGNEIVFPAGIMQFPVFGVELPSYLSYGAFGSVSGHELSHAFDSTGRHYDETGNYTDWWTENTVAEFEKRAECFVKQYSEFTVEGPDGKPLHVNGRLTLGENIADAGGVSAAFAAWNERKAAQHGVAKGENLPGLEFFSQDQLFFVNYAQWWCGKDRKESAINSVYTDPHAPKRTRIMGTMSNSRAFRQSFGCKSKEPTCELW